MPHRRTTKKGSFAGHLDEVVRHFPQDLPRPKSDRPDRHRKGEDGDIHDKLFKSSWRTAPEKA
jgi:hypothetical protein